MSEPTAEQTARRFQLATKIEALAEGAKTISDNLADATDDTVVEALTRLRREVQSTRGLAEIVRYAAQLDRVEAEDV